MHRLGAAAVIVAVDADAIGDTYGDGYRAIAERYGAGVVTGLLKDVFAKPEYMIDFIHPTAEGHVFLADRIAAAVDPILARMPAARAVHTP